MSCGSSRSASHFAVGCAVAATSMLACGGCVYCNTPGEWRAAGGDETQAEEAATTEWHSRTQESSGRVNDIMRIVTMWGSDPWIRDGDRLAVGVKPRVYFIDSETERGSFVDGTIEAALYTVTPTPSGRSQKVFMHEWKLNREQAARYRSRKFVTGYSYRLKLPWPQDIEVHGCQSEIVFAYLRRDGTLISSRKQLRVPALRDSVEKGQGNAP